MYFWRHGFLTHDSNTVHVFLTRLHQTSCSYELREGGLLEMLCVACFHTDVRVAKKAKKVKGTGKKSDLIVNAALLPVKRASRALSHTHFLMHTNP